MSTTKANHPNPTMSVHEKSKPSELSNPSLWKDLFFPYIGVSSVGTQIRNVNKGFRTVSDSWILQELKRSQTLIRFRVQDTDSYEDHTRILILAIVVGQHTGSYTSRDNLIDASISVCEDCWNYGMYNSLAKEYCKFVADDGNNDNNERDTHDAEDDELELDDDRLRREFNEHQMVDANDGGYGWQVSFDIISQHEKQKNASSSSEKEKDANDVVKTIRMKDSNIPFYQYILEGFQECDLPGKDYCSLKKFLDILLNQAAVSANSDDVRLATGIKIHNHPDFEDNIAYSGTESCLQFHIIMAKDHDDEDGETKKTPKKRKYNNELANNDKEEEENAMMVRIPVEVRLLEELRSRDFHDSYPTTSDFGIYNWHCLAGQSLF